MIEGAPPAAATVRQFCATLSPVALSAALAALGRIILRRNTIPILANVILTVEPSGRMTAAGTDLDIQGTWDFGDVSHNGYGDTLPGRVTVSAHALADIVKRFDKAGNIRLEFDPERGKLDVTAGRHSFALATLPADDFPLLVTGDPTRAYVTDAATFIGDLARLQPAMSSEETREYMRGVEIRDTADGLAMTATCGRTASMVMRPTPAGAEGLESVIMPAKAVDVLARVHAKATGAAAIGFGKHVVKFGEGALTYCRIMVRIGALTLWTKVVDATYPDAVSAFAPGFAGEGERVMFPAMEPRLNQGQLDRLAKPHKGAALDIAFAPSDDPNKGGMFVLTRPDAPEWFGLIMESKFALPKGYDYDPRGLNDEGLQRYARLIALQRGHDIPKGAYGHITRNGPDGACVAFGEVGKPGYCEVEVAGPNWQAAVMLETVADDGTVTATRIATNSAGAIALSADDVRRIAGPVDPSTFVAIPRAQYWQGHAVAAGWHVPTPPRLDPRAALAMGAEAYAAYSASCAPLWVGGGEAPASPYETTPGAVARAAEIVAGRETVVEAATAPEPVEIAAPAMAAPEAAESESPKHIVEIDPAVDPLPSQEQEWREGERPESEWVTNPTVYDGPESTWPGATPEDDGFDTVYVSPARPVAPGAPAVAPVAEPVAPEPEPDAPLTPAPAAVANAPELAATVAMLADAVNALQNAVAALQGRFAGNSGAVVAEPSAAALPPMPAALRAKLADSPCNIVPAATVAPPRSREVRMRLVRRYLAMRAERAAIIAGNEREIGDLKAKAFAATSRASQIMNDSLAFADKAIADEARANVAEARAAAAEAGERAALTRATVAEAEAGTLREQMAEYRDIAARAGPEAEAVQAGRVHSLAEALAGARRRGDRLRRIAEQDRRARKRMADDLRAAKAETRAFEARLQRALADAIPAVPAPRPEIRNQAMAVAFAAAHERKAA